LRLRGAGAERNIFSSTTLLCKVSADFLVSVNGMKLLYTGTGDRSPTWGEN
jgi:hypothetical protein